MLFLNSFCNETIPEDDFLDLSLEFDLDFDLSLEALTGNQSLFDVIISGLVVGEMPSSAPLQSKCYYLYPVLFLQFPVMIYHRNPKVHF